MEAEPSFEQEFDSVFVIESLLPGDPDTGTSIHANSISPHGRRKGLRVEWGVRRVHSVADLMGSLEDIRSVVRREALSPILQLDTHGDRDGIQLGSGEFVRWAPLASALAAINRESRNSLFVVASCCRGAYLVEGLTQAFQIPVGDPIRGRAPFWGVVGPTDDVYPQPLREQLEAFYLQLIGAEASSAALEALGQLGCHVEYAERVFARGFRLYVDENLNPDRVDARVASVHGESGLPEVWIRRRMFDFEQDFLRMRARYLWIDEFPRIAERFRLTFAQMLNLEGP